MSTRYTGAVMVSAGLSNTASSNPSIGSQSSLVFDFIDGGTVTDTYTSVAVTTATVPGSPPTYLTPVIASGDMWALVTNLANGLEVILYACVSTTYTPIGRLMAGACMLVPLQAGTRIGASVASTAQTVGVTFTAVEMETA